MKQKIILMALFACVIAQAGAQDAINFTAVYPEQKGLSNSVKEGLKQKVEQIIGRNNAGATSVYNAFIIQPELTVQETKSTEGLVRNVTLVTGELTLTAKNLYDESIYGTLVLNLEGDATGNQEAALNALLRNIKVTNPAFTRFIRTTREKILGHYMANCQTIMTKAQTMISMDMVVDAIGYLGSVPEVVPCYEEAASLMTLAYSHAKTLECDQIMLMARAVYALGDYETAISLLMQVPASSSCRDEARALTDSIGKQVNYKPDTTPVETVTEEVLPEEPAPASDYKVNISCADMDFELISCEGNTNTQSILLYCRLTNKAKGTETAIYMSDVIDENGAVHTNLSQSKMYGCSNSVYNNNMPNNVAINKCFVIGDITAKLNKLSYVQVVARGCTIALRNVPVTWK